MIVEAVPGPKPEDLPAPETAGLSRTKEAAALAWCCGAFALFHIYTAFAGSLSPLVQRGLFIGGGMMLAWWSFAATSHGWRKALPWLLAVLSLYAGLHVMISSERFMDVMNDLTVVDKAVASMALVLLIAATQRLLGWALPILATVGLIYYVWGNGFIDGMWQPPRVSAETALSTLYASTGGIFGFMADIGTGVIAIYIIYGALLMATGAGEVFIQLATRVAGRGHGGAAKVAVVTSALFGTVSGSAAANVMAVGTMTIPTMRRAGYSKAFAGGVEASASAGGQIMPPVMGAGAFLMAELLSIPYVEVAKAATLPALLYFALLFVGVDLYARKHRLGATPVPRTRIMTDKAIPLAGSVFMLIYLLASNFTVTFAGAMAIMTLVALVVVCRVFPSFVRTDGQGLMSAAKTMVADIARGLADGGRGLIMIAVLLGSVGILAVILGASGLGTKVSSALLDLAGNQLILALIITAALCILLGMDVPTTASYVLAASVAVPVLTKLGIPALTAHLFIFYFAILSAITPPVCASVFCAAAIAEESFWRVARSALLIAGGVYFLPFMMVYRPGLLLDGSWFDIAYAAAITALALFCMSAAAIGYLVRALSIFARLILVVIGLLFFIPGVAFDASATALLIAFVVVQRIAVRRITATQSPVAASSRPGKTS